MTCKPTSIGPATVALPTQTLTPNNSGTPIPLIPNTYVCATVGDTPVVQFNGNGSAISWLNTISEGQRSRQGMPVGEIEVHPKMDGHLGATLSSEREAKSQKTGRVSFGNIV